MHNKESEQRVEEHRIKKTDKSYKLLLDKFEAGRKLYNALNGIQTDYYDYVTYPYRKPSLEDYVNKLKIKLSFFSDLDSTEYKSLKKEHDRFEKGLNNLVDRFPKIVLNPELLSELSKLPEKKQINISKYGIIPEFILKKLVHKEGTHLYNLYIGSNLGSMVCDNIALNLGRSWKGYHESLMKYHKDPSNFTGRPQPPNFKAYIRKDYPVLTLDGAFVKFKSGNTPIYNKYFDFIHVPFNKYNGEYDLNTTKKHNLAQVRIIYCKGYIKLEYVYDLRNGKYEHELKEDNGRYLGIDPGLNYFAAIVNNFGEQPLLINGYSLEKINSVYHSKSEIAVSILEQMNKKKRSKKLEKLEKKRNDKMLTEIHRISAFIRDYCVEHDVSKVIAGDNKEQKQNIKLSGDKNKRFVPLPHKKFLDLLGYKLNSVGVELIRTEESYTSKTSFIDGDIPDKSGSRGERVYCSTTGIEIDPDVNGAYQIMRKYKLDSVVYSESTPLVGKLLTFSINGKIG